MKKILKKEGYKFYTETDTEVLVNFIELCVSNSKSIDKGISFALSKLEGAFGIVLIKNSNPDIMYAARKGSPLAFGKKGNNFFIASDATPIIEYTKKIIYLDNEHLLKINGNDFEILDLSAASGSTQKLNSANSRFLGSPSLCYFVVFWSKCY